jgi:hypothetical protein
LARHGTAEAFAVADAASSTLSDVDLLVVGAPTHAWGLPRAKSRASVDSGLTGTLLRDWLADMPAGDGRPAAAFATRLAKPRLLTGSAAGGITRRVRRRGWRATKPATFVVTASPGPLGEGELAKAVAWGDQLGADVESVRTRS